MALNASTAPSTGGNFKEENPLEAKLYPARLVEVIDLGLQPQRPYQGKDKPPAHSVRFTYELSFEFMKTEAGEDIKDKPKWLGEDMPLHNLEVDKANSTRRYNALDPAGTFNGDFEQLIGAPCQVMVTKIPDKKNEGYFKNYVGDVSAALEVPGFTQPALVNPTKVFNLDSPNLEVFNKLPDWVQKRVKANLEFTGSPLDVLLGGTAAPKETPTASEPTYDPSLPSAPE